MAHCRIEQACKCNGWQDSASGSCISSQLIEVGARNTPLDMNDVLRFEGHAWHYLCSSRFISSSCRHRAHATTCSLSQH